MVGVEENVSRVFGPPLVWRRRVCLYDLSQSLSISCFLFFLFLLCLRLSIYLCLCFDIPSRFEINLFNTFFLMRATMGEEEIWRPTTPFLLFYFILSSFLLKNKFLFSHLFLDSCFSFIP
jgi:hypothetical protein